MKSCVQQKLQTHSWVSIFSAAAFQPSVDSQNKPGPCCHKFSALFFFWRCMNGRGDGRTPWWRPSLPGQPACLAAFTVQITWVEERRRAELQSWGRRDCRRGGEERRGEQMRGQDEERKGEERLKREKERRGGSTLVVNKPYIGGRTEVIWNIMDAHNISAWLTYPAADIKVPAELFTWKLNTMIWWDVALSALK